MTEKAPGESDTAIGDEQLTEAEQQVADEFQEKINNLAQALHAVMGTRVLALSLGATFALQREDAAERQEQGLPPIIPVTASGTSHRGAKYGRFHVNSFAQILGAVAKQQAEQAPPEPKGEPS